MAIARTAWLPIAVVSVVAGFAYVLCGIICGLPPIIIAMALFFLFRDPNRTIPPLPLGVVSPVDGRVVAVDEVRDPFLGRDAVKIVIRMQPLGPWILRSAMEVRVIQQWYLSMGLDPQLVAGMDKDILDRDPLARQAHFAIWVQSDELDDVVIAMRGFYISQRLRCFVQAGERIGQGQRCGLLLFGATADVYLPANSRIDVIRDGTVRAGSDIIATLIHKETPATPPVTGQ